LEHGFDSPLRIYRVHDFAAFGGDGTAGLTAFFLGCDVLLFLVDPGFSAVSGDEVYEEGFPLAFRRPDDVVEVGADAGCGGGGGEEDEGVGFHAVEEELFE
jgi:hypothetical protein